MDGLFKAEAIDTSPGHRNQALPLAPQATLFLTGDPNLCKGSAADSTLQHADDKCGRRAGSYD